jgi:hypothetical protein
MGKAEHSCSGSKSSLVSSDELDISFSCRSSTVSTFALEEHDSMATPSGNLGLLSCCQLSLSIIQDRHLRFWNLRQRLQTIIVLVLHLQTDNHQLRVLSSLRCRFFRPTGHCLRMLLLNLPSPCCHLIPTKPLSGLNSPIPPSLLPGGQPSLAMTTKSNTRFSDHGE